ncbi:MAG: ParA family protein [Ideonella sp.]|nr:ParA family protein [Ideonella sp.]MCC7456758.1 ParA family protein [Nitrospira sp.]
MPVIVVANPKGGVGKSTLATNVAGLYARQGHAVMLGDIDRQQSSRQWLALRPTAAPAIKPWDVVGGSTLRVPRGVTHVVLDTPAGLHDQQLEQVVRLADRIVVPLQPSLFDIQATHAFVRELLARPARGRAPKIALVGMRVKDHTISNDQLHQFLGGLKLPVLGYLRDTQNYVHLAARGLTLWDVAPGRVERDLEQWQPLVTWLNHG